jgi:hypothetical protein
MTAKSLCIHGHFYQPPRMDPWMDKIFPEGSAAPYRHWNERICRESYAPLAWARRTDGEGRILDILNCYEWMSFNFGPTLISWMERSAPDTYARLLEADRKSLARWGHGNAMAQIHHHVIMPLATPADKEAEVAWAVADFESRFQRPPEGLWLSEAAVDTPTLAVLADYGITYTILAPRQVRAVSDASGGNWRQVAEWEVDIREPYRVDLPGGKSIAVFFYNGPISQAVAFEGLLSDGERFWNRLSGASTPGLLSLATDGETYGHHFAFGEMALAHVLAQAVAGRDGVGLTNFGAYLAANPPRRRALLQEESSWSCVHGVERWRADCGCTTGGGPGWNQRWRKPLREALDALKKDLDRHFAAKGQALFRDPGKALVGYGRALSGLLDQDGFAAAYFKPKLSAAQTETAWKLLAMQKWALASFASCAWFFEDIGRIEPLNAMTFALRAMELAAKTGAGDLEPAFAEWLAGARSNDPALGTGKDLWDKRVKRRQETPHQITLQALLSLAARKAMPEPGASARVDWPGVSVEVSVATQDRKAGSGEVRVSWSLEDGAETHAWVWTRADGPGLLRGTLKVWPFSTLGRTKDSSAVVLSGAQSALSWKKLQDLSLGFIESAEEKSWRQQLDEARRGLEFFQPFEEGQKTQTYAGKWRRFWASLSWRVVVDGAPDCPGMADLQDFLRLHGPEHTDREMLLFRIKNHLMDLLARPGNLPEIEAILNRMASLGLQTDLWEVQNRYWTNRESLGRGGAELERMLGFRV